MWWLMAIISGLFIYGFSRPRHTTVNNYIEQDTYVDCDNGGDSYCDSGDYSDSDGGSDAS